MTHTSPTEIEKQVKEFYINCNNGYYRSFEDGGEQARTDLIALINQSQLELLEDIRAEAYSKSSLELVAHAKGVIVDTNKVKWDIFEERLSTLQAERKNNE